MCPPHAAEMEVIEGARALAVAPTSQQLTERGTLELVYPPREPAAVGAVACTILEYGATGLLVRGALRGSPRP